MANAEAVIDIALTADVGAPSSDQRGKCRYSAPSENQGAVLLTSIGRSYV